MTRTEPRERTITVTLSAEALARLDEVRARLGTGLTRDDVIEALIMRDDVIERLIES